MALAKKKAKQPNVPSANGESDVEACSDALDVESCSEAHEDDKYAYIAEAAYYRAEARGFEPGHELDDWLAAEDEIHRE